MDLIQEGNIGLMHAAEKYDYTKDNRFFNLRVMVDQRGNYKSHRSAVKRNSSSGSRCGKYENGCQKAAKELQQEFGREAEPGEIAKKLGDRTEEEVKNILLIFEIRYLWKLR